MATYSFNGQNYSFPDDVTQEEALEFIDQQTGGSSAPTETQQEAPQAPQPQSQPITQAQPTEAPTDTDSALENGFNYVGNVAASGGRMIAGGVAGLANVGVGALNTIGQGVQSLSNAITGEDGQYQPIPAAGYGELDQYLMPRSTGEKFVADVVPYVVGGEVVAPLKAAEGAGTVAKFATSVANQLPASLAGGFAEHNQGNDAGDLAADVAINSVMGGTLERVGSAAIKGARNLLPESLGGFSAAEKAANVVNPEYLNKATQAGNEEAQQAFRTATSDAAGNSLLTPSQVFNTNEGGKFIRAEQRDLSRGADSAYQARLDAQKGGEGITRAVDDAATPVNGDVSLLQQAAQDTTGAFKQRANQLYTESKDSAQQILDNAPVKITNLKMPETKAIALQHLEQNAATGNINLNAETRRTLTQFNKAELNNINTLDQWKRTLNEKAQKAYRSGDFTSYQALNEVKNSFKDETNSVISAIDPRAGSLWRDADSFYSSSVGDFGDKSILGKIAGKDNPDLAANALIRGQNAEYNTQQIVTALQDAINRGDIPNAQALAAQLGQGLGDATRSQAVRAATTGENFSPTKFVNTVSRLEPQAEAADALGAIGNQSQINNALADAVRVQRDRAVMPQTNDLVAQLAGRATGGGLGSLIGGPAGAVIGQEVGGRVTKSVSQGLLDRLAGTVKRGNKYIDYLSNPENAQAVADVLAARGATFDNATAQEVKGIIDNIRKGATSEGRSLLFGDSDQQVDNSPAFPDAVPQAERQAEPEQHAQAVKVPTNVGSRKAVNLYKSLASAETGSLGNRYIRTKASEGAPSTAYGPAQITTTLAKDYINNHSQLFTAKELDYLDRFVKQGQKMLRADDNDPVYGYGGTGVLGDSKADQKLYARVAVKMLDHMIDDNGGSLDKTVRRWRGANDRAYFNKVRDAMQTLRAGN